METKHRVTFLTLFTFLSIIAPTLMSGRQTIMLRISTDDGSLFTRGEIGISRNDSLVAFLVTDRSEETIEVDDPGEHILSLTSTGYTPIERVVPDTAFVFLDLLLERESVTLGEVTVTGSHHSEVTPTGESFTLSKHARDSGNPFTALSEIPLLHVDISNQTVRLRDGSTPLVLIDGRMINTGIAPIDPRFIERVDVSEVVSAKYMNMGVTKIIDIRLRRNIPRYLFSNLLTRHELPLREGYGGYSFETGTRRFAAFGSLEGSYTHRDLTETASSEMLGSSVKYKETESYRWSSSIWGMATLKWAPYDSDYFALVFGGRANRAKTRGNGGGSCLTDDGELGLHSITDNRQRSTPLHIAAMHEHTFRDNSTLTTFVRYQEAWGKTRDHYSEDIGSNVSSYRNLQDNRFDRETVSVDYSGAIGKLGSIMAGDELNVSCNRLLNLNTDPAENARVRYLVNYTYLTWSRRIGRVSSMASAGLQLFRLDADGTRHSYWRPKVSASVSVPLGRRSFVRGNYYLDNGNPPEHYLFVFDNSTDPWVRMKGNPYLKPIMRQQFNLVCEQPAGPGSVNAAVLHMRTSHMFESCLRNEGDHVVQSYRNNGTYRGTTLTAGYSLFTDNVQGYLSASYTVSRFEGQGSHGSWSVGGYLRWEFGRFFLFTQVDWRNRAYPSNNGFTRYHNPSTASLMLSWRVSDNVSVSASLPYFWGVRKETVYVSQDGYDSRVKTSYRGQSFRPCILVSWTLYRNADQSIEDKILQRAGSL